MKRRIALALAVVVGTSASPLSAQLATFDSGAGCVIGGASLIPNGYEGFNWTNFYVVDGADATVRTGGPGYENGMVTPNCVALNGFGEAAELSAGSPFIFNGGYFTAAFSNSLSLRIQAFSGATPVFSHFMTLNTSGPQLLDVAWANVDRVRFESGTGQPGSQFVFDNFRFNNTPDPSIPPTVVPEPMTMLLLGTGLAGVAIARRRRKQDQA